MPFLVRKLSGDEQLVKVLYAGLVSDRVKHVVVARRNSIEIFNAGAGDALELRKSVPIWDNVIDCGVFQPQQGITASWLVIVTDSNKLILVAFKQDLEHVVIEELTLNQEGANTNLSIIPGTLCIDSQCYIAVHAREGSLCVFEVHKSKDLKNFEKALAQTIMKGTKPSNIKLFNSPKFYTLCHNRERSPMLIETIFAHPEDADDHKTFSMLHRNDVYKYFCSFASIDGRDRLVHEKSISFGDESGLSPVIVPLERNLGVFFFGSDTIFLRPYKSLVPDIVLGAKLNEAKESTIERIEDRDGLSFITKSIFGIDWKVSSGIVIERIDSQDPFMMLLADKTGRLFFSKIDIEIEQDENFVGDIERLILKSWKIYEFKKSGLLFPSIEFINQLSETTFLVSSSSGSQLLRLNFNERSFEILQTFKCSAPVLDFNITGTNVPKLQTVSGFDLDSGLIKTEFKGYSHTSKDELKLRLPKTETVTDFWKVGNVIITNELVSSSFKILDTSKGYAVELDDFHNLKSINGSILDLKLSRENALLVVTEAGIFKDGECQKVEEITNATITLEDEIIYSTKNSVVQRENTIKHSEEVSSMSGMRYKNKTFLLIGNWDGTAYLYSNGSKKRLIKSNLAIRSVLIKRLKSDKLMFLVGDGEGKIMLIDETLNVTEYKIGESPVELIDYQEDSFIGFNAENVIKFDLENGVVSERGYLKIDPENCILKYADGKLYSLEASKSLKTFDLSSGIEVLSNETFVPKLVRKSINFQNHLNLSVFVTISEHYDSKADETYIQSRIEVIENNTFKVKSIIKLDDGIEITDIINLKYEKKQIDTYEEEDISIAYQKVLSQCFIVSCISHQQDMNISPLKLFTVDETGLIHYQASCAVETDDVNLYSLTNHGCRLVIGGGNVMICYKVEYSVVNSKFSINKVSLPYKPRFFISNVKSMGSDVIVGDVIEGLKKLQLKVRKENLEGGLVFKFVESANYEFSRLHFFTGLELYENIGFSTDSLGNVIISLLGDEAAEVICQFNIADKINVVKKVPGSILSRSQIMELLNESSIDCPKIIPMFVLGSVNGCVYLASWVTDQDLAEELSTAQVDAIQKVRPIQKSSDLLKQYEEFRKTRGATRFTQGEMIQYLDGDLLHEYGAPDIRDLIDHYCVLL